MMKRLLFIPLLFIASAASGTTYTVCSSGCDFTTGQACFSGVDLGPGDTCYAQENLTESITWGSNDDGSAAGYVTLECADGVSIDCTGTADHCLTGFFGRSYFQVKNCIIKNADAGKYGFNIVGADNFKLDTVEVSGCDRGVWISQSGAGDDMNGVILKDVTAHDNIKGIFVNYGNAVTPSGIRKFRLEGTTTLYSNSEEGIKVNSTNIGVAGNYIYDFYANDIIAYNNGYPGVSLSSIKIDTYTRNTIDKIVSYNNSDSATWGNIGLGGIENFTISYVESYEAHTTGIDGVGLFFDWDSANGCNDVIVDVAKIYNISDADYATVHDGACVHFYKATNSGIKNGLLYNCNNGIVVGDAATTGNFVYNATVDGNTHDNFHSRNAAPALVLKNSILYGGERGVFVDAGATAPDETYNIVFGASVANFSGDTADATTQTTDPLFVDAGSNDYRLQQNSPARGAGAGTKFNGLPADIGAFQTSEGTVDSHILYKPGFPLGSTYNTTTP